MTDANTPTFRINGNDLVMRSVAFDLGNDVQTRLLVNAENVIIVKRNELATCQIEAVPLAVFNPYEISADPSARVPVELVHGTVAGRIAALKFQNAQIQRPASFEVQQNIAEWPIRLKPLPVDGDDQWTLTLT